MLSPAQPARYELSIPPRLEFLPVVRHSVEASVPDGSGHLDRLRLVLTEVLSNAMRAMDRSEGSRVNHGTVAGRSNIDVSWTVGPDEVDVYVTDRAGGFDPDETVWRMSICGSDGVGREGGLGLGLISTFADCCEFERVEHGTRVHFVVRV